MCAPFTSEERNLSSLLRLCLKMNYNQYSSQRGEVLSKANCSIFKLCLGLERWTHLAQRIYSLIPHTKILSNAISI